MPRDRDALNLSRMRSPITSRSNWAKDSRMLSVSRPMLVVVLNDCVTETNVSRSQRHLAGALAERGFTASQKLVGRLLRKLGFSLQANRKTLEGAAHPDRDAQFEHINQRIKQFQGAGQPAISVDTKKKELVGDFRNGGRELRPKGDPEPVRVHDFKIPELGKVAPYGVYDIAANSGWVNIGIDHDTAAFAVESIRRWWRALGKKRYPGATS